MAIQYDLFACTPLLLSAGAMLAARYGGSGAPFHPLREMVRIPPLWAAVVGALLNLANVPMPSIVEGLLEKLDYLCHTADQDADPDALETLHTPAEIRAKLRFTDAGKFRGASPPSVC